MRIGQVVPLVPDYRAGSAARRQRGAWGKRRISAGKAPEARHVGSAAHRITSETGRERGADLDRAAPRAGNACRVTGRELTGSVARRQHNGADSTTGRKGGTSATGRERGGRLDRAAPRGRQHVNRSRSVADYRNVTFSIPISVTSTGQSYRESRR